MRSCQPHSQKGKLELQCYSLLVRNCGGSGVYIMEYLAFKKHVTPQINLEDVTLSETSHP